MNLNANNEIAGKTILLVNTGTAKKRFVLSRLSKLGVKIIALNKEKNWAAPYVDNWIIADNNNHSEAIQAVKEFIDANPNVKIDGVITFWEDDVLLTSRLAERFNWIGIPLRVSKKARNKFAFRKFCEENKIPYPRYMEFNSEADIKSITKKLKFPLVIKPAYGSSSAYVVKVEDKKELLETFRYIKKTFSVKIESALSDGSDIYVEEYIDGDEVDIDVLIQNGRIKFYSISDNTKTEEPFFIEADRLTPSNLPDKDQEELAEMADDILEKLKIDNGCIHLEAKATKKGPVPIEVNLRMGGDEIYASVKKAWKVDLIEDAVKIALGINVPKVKKSEEPEKYLIARTLNPEYSGIIIQLDVDQKLEKEKYLEEFELYKEVGDPVLVPPEGYEYLGWIMVSGDNYLDAQENMNSAIDMINYQVAKFDAGSSFGKTARKSRFDSATIQKDIILQEAKFQKIRNISIKEQRKLHIGVACNLFDLEGVGNEVNKDLTSVGLTIKSVLESRGYKTTFFDFNNAIGVINDLKKNDVDMVFNVCERINNSSLLEPHAASILDILQIPYTGSNPFTLGLCIDKIRVKKLLNFHNIPTANWDYVYSLNDAIKEDLKYPLIVKPANSDNSIGITNDSVVSNKEALYQQLEKMFRIYKQPVLIEEYIEGDEYDVSILGSEKDDLRVLPLSRSIFDKMPKGYWHIYPYEAKFLGDKTYKKNIIVERPPKKINKKLESLISEIALDTYKILDCHDYGRVEIRVDEQNNPYVLELNPNPSINIGDCVPSVAELVGLNYGDFIEEIIRLAIKRYKNNPPYHHLLGGDISL